MEFHHKCGGDLSTVDIRKLFKACRQTKGLYITFPELIREEVEDFKLYDPTTGNDWPRSPVPRNSELDLSNLQTLTLDSIKLDHGDILWLFDLLEKPLEDLYLIDPSHAFCSTFNTDSLQKIKRIHLTILPEQPRYLDKFMTFDEKEQWQTDLAIDV